MIRGGFSYNCARRSFLIYWGLYLYYGNREVKVMAFDGITIANIRKELDEALTGDRFIKSRSLEPDELLLTIKNNGTQQRVTLSASASPSFNLSD